MRYVILRDDDANATTPPDILEQLYRPFLNDGMPVHLAVIPEVRTNTIAPHGEIEGFILGTHRGEDGCRPLAENTALLDYLRHEPGYGLLQHGLKHEFVDGHFEFDRDDPSDIVHRIERGAQLLNEAGVKRPLTFVAPQDKLSRTALIEVSRRFPIISTGWFSLSKLPKRWWPAYSRARVFGRHSPWKTRKNTYLTHPGCILSYNRAPDTILPELQRKILSQRLTVVVSHHWEYFTNGEPNRPYIGALKSLHEWLRKEPNIKVIRFEEARQII